MPLTIIFRNAFSSNQFYFIFRCQEIFQNIKFPHSVYSLQFYTIGSHTSECLFLSRGCFDLLLPLFNPRQCFVIHNSIIHFLYGSYLFIELQILSLFFFQPANEYIYFFDFQVKIIVTFLKCIFQAWHESPHIKQKYIGSMLILVNDSK